MPDVFISYPNQDKKAADAACAALEADGIRCWIAPRDVAPGADWAAAIIDALDRCRVMLLIFSSNTNESRQIYREVQRAVDRNIPIVPLRIENIEPTRSLAYFLGPVHWLDAFTPSLEPELKRLSAAVKSHLPAHASGDQAVGEPQWQRPDEQRDRPAGTQSKSASRAGLGWLIGAAAVAATVAVVWLLSARGPFLPTSSTPRQGAAIEGVFKGTMHCEKLPWTAAPLEASISLSLKGGKASFLRDVYARDGKRKAGIEAGTGTLDADGLLQLTTSWVGQTNRFDGAYAGRLSATGGSLAGKQILLVDGARHERSCTIIIQKVEER
jgi:hypothetical protein